MFYLMQRLNQSAGEAPPTDVFVDTSPEIRSASLAFTPNDLNDEFDLAASEGTPGSPAVKRTHLHMTHSLKALKYLAQDNQAQGSENWMNLCDQLTKFDTACSRAHSLRARAAAWNLSLTRTIHSELAVECSLIKSAVAETDSLRKFHRWLEDTDIKPAQWTSLSVFPSLHVNITPTPSSQSGPCDFIGLLVEAEEEAWAPFPLADILPDVKQEFKDLVRDKLDLGTQILKGSEFSSYEDLVASLIAHNFDEANLMTQILNADENQQMKMLREFRLTLIRYLCILRFISRTFSGALFYHVLAPLVAEEYKGRCQLVPLSSGTPPLQLYSAPIQHDKLLFDRVIYASTNLSFAVRDPCDSAEKVESIFHGRLSILAESLSSLGDDLEIDKLGDTLGMPSRLRLRGTGQTTKNLVNIYWPIAGPPESLFDAMEGASDFTSLVKSLRLHISSHPSDD